MLKYMYLPKSAVGIGDWARVDSEKEKLYTYSHALWTLLIV